MNFWWTSQRPLTPSPLPSLRKTMLRFFATNFSDWSDPPLFPKIHRFYPSKLPPKTATNFFGSEMTPPLRKFSENSLNLVQIVIPYFQHCNFAKRSRKYLKFLPFHFHFAKLIVSTHLQVARLLSFSAGFKALSRWQSNACLPGWWWVVSHFSSPTTRRQKSQTGRRNSPPALNLFLHLWFLLFSICSISYIWHIYSNIYSTQQHSLGIWTEGDQLIWNFKKNWSFVYNPTTQSPAVLS